MAIPFHTAFADLSLLTVCMFFIAANQSQQEFEQIALPVSQEIPASSVDELGPDVKVLNLRWFPDQKMPPAVQQQYQAQGWGDWIAGDWIASDVSWQGRALAPAPRRVKLRPNTICGLYDRYWVLGETARTWPKDAPILIRAESHLPFKYIDKVFNVFRRHDLNQHPVFLGLAVEKE
jgi:hypothetical protein